MRHINNHRKPRRTWTLWHRRRAMKSLLFLRVMCAAVSSAAAVKVFNHIIERHPSNFPSGGIIGGRGTEGEVVLSKQQQEQLAQVMRENPDKIYIAKTNR